ncbi:MAG: CopG family transcriptional regulator [Chloroflexi bacterium]|nr:CopG family transcriptional regulator [Chloroflexota bacterium]MCI0649029.1 CopG family transcriptional regulator [Chloroflexota bacterium]
MVRTQIQLTEEQSEMLKRIAADQDKSVAELVRQSVDNFIRLTEGVSLEERRRRAIAAAGKFRSGLADVAVEHDRYLVEAYSAG